MSITEQQETTIPAGTYGADRVHSTVAFEVRLHGHRPLRRRRHGLRGFALSTAGSPARHGSRAWRRRTRTCTRT